MPSNTALPPPSKDSRKLAAENRALRQLLKNLTDDASYNQTVMQRFHERELSLLSAADLPELLECLTDGMRASFTLDAVHLVLLDPFGVLRELLGGLGVDLASLPDLRLLDNLDELQNAYPSLHEPCLGPCGPDMPRVLRLRPGVRSVAVLPLRQPEGLSGFLHLGSRSPDRFRPEQATDFLQRLANVAAVCLENAVNRERLRLTGLTDGLTGLYNRRHLEHRLHQEVIRAKRHDHPLSCLFIDADHFKRINDQHGHAVGDQVLIAIAKRVRDQLRGSDLPTRYGGEEIAVLLPQTDADSAAALAERIREHVAAFPIQVEAGESIHATVSIGVAQLSPQGDADACARRLLNDADQQTYRAKRRGRNQVAVAAS